MGIPCQEILVISGNTEFTFKLREILLSASGFFPFYASSLPEALRLLAQNPIAGIILGPSPNRLSASEWCAILNELTPAIPLLIHRGSKPFFGNGNFRRLKKNGRLFFLNRSLDREETITLIERAVKAGGDAAGENHSPEQAAFQLLQIEEKLIAIQTSLEILSHDTKDLFVRILTIISDIPEGNHKSILSDYINELYDCMTEAIGFMSAQKRIEPLIDIVNRLKVGKDKIPLPSQSRIELRYDSRKLLFIESGRLIRHALANVIDNALKYSAPEGKIRLEISRHGEEIRLRVIDSGIGIPDSERSEIFKKGFRSSRSQPYEGTGKGLWIARHIIKEENGEIFAEANPSGGTIMSIVLPAFNLHKTGRRLAQLSDWFKSPYEVVEKKASVIKTILNLEFPGLASDLDSLVFANLLDHFRDERQKRERQKYYFKLREFTLHNPQGRTVLLVDDSLYVHYTIAPILTDQGFRIVDFAFNGIEAFNLYQVFNPELVVMDITMPAKSGIETAQDILKLNPLAKILFVTALGEYKPLLESVASLFQGRRCLILSKPIRASKLLDLVNLLLNDQNEEP